MFFAKPGEYEATGLYSIGHLTLLAITIIGVAILSIKTKEKNQKQVRKTIQIITIAIWILEIIKIIFNLAIGNKKNVNNYIPLYFCSMNLYAGILSGFCKGKLKHLGDVFIATGGLIAGIVFILFPNTSLTIYPAFHYISIQSFVYHGAMIYLGILLNITGYVKIEVKDIIYYAGFVLAIEIIALCFNLIFDSNLMFISKDYPGTPIHLLYKLTGALFTPFVIIAQATIPFYIAYWGLKKSEKNELVYEYN